MTAQRPSDTDPSEINPGAALDAMRSRAPLVQMITNYVAMTVSANVLIASGAAPAMIHAREEAAEFARIASALAVNIGTLSTPWRDAMLEAAAAARDAGAPWALDPVAVGATAFRREAGAARLALKPDAIRGNASEIIALAGAGAAGRGVAAADDVADAEAAARDLAAATGGVVAVTGAVDYVTDGRRAARVAGGHALMPKVTALGCALTGVVAAFAASGPDRFESAVAALAFYAVAGETAAEGAAGPGTFAVRFLDALHALDPATLDARARIS